jgi:hypothetical protein
VGSCKDGNELSGSIKDREFLSQGSDISFSAPWIRVVLRINVSLEIQHTQSLVANASLHYTVLLNSGLISYESEDTGNKT